jgi:riboflavin transporter FmnP
LREKLNVDHRLEDGIMRMWVRDVLQRHATSEQLQGIGRRINIIKLVNMVSGTSWMEHAKRHIVQPACA